MSKAKINQAKKFSNPRTTSTRGTETVTGKKRGNVITRGNRTQCGEPLPWVQRSYPDVAKKKNYPREGHDRDHNDCTKSKHAKAIQQHIL
nr:unnamed protein product [Callosobruchus chinensis]